MDIPVIVVERAPDAGWHVAGGRLNQPALAASLGAALDLAAALTGGKPARIVVCDDSDRAPAWRLR
ncbi:MAG: hypothetical protein RMK15_09585 [Chloroflexota bacterium]|nr:hypothetical protein [Dehalococcoidia bacterium]MDW8047513.1 hypothetical protein [Chloroflexota bacterium]